MIRVEAGDCIEVMRSIEEGSIDAVVTDPPYDLGFMGKAWDKIDGQAWHEQWAREAVRVLRPGGYMLSFGAPRTYHRLTCAVEDAGFVIQDCIMWLFGTGYPKGREHLKPAYEPIVVAYKPGGARTLQVEECRVGSVVETWPKSRARPVNNAHYTHKLAGDLNTVTVATGEAPLGRWPANVCHDGSAEVLAGFPETETHPKTKAGYSNNSGSSWNLPEDGGAIYAANSGSAARFFYTAKAGAEDRWGSRHPTVKPVDLMRWLVPLVTPPGGMLLDPFAGSGTTGVAALATGRSAILIEREPEYLADIRERLAHYAGDGRHSLASKGRNAAPRGDAPLFDGAGL